MRRLALSILLLFLLKVAFAQVSPLDKIITVQVNKKPLKEVFSQITRQTGLFFSYNPDRLNDRQQVTFIARSRKASDVLAALSSDFGFTYHVVDNTVIIKIPEHKQTTAGKKKVSISGYVLDSASGEVIIGAAIFVDKKLVALSNEYGFFSFRTTTGKHLLEASYIGYSHFVQVINLSHSQQVTIKLKINPQKLDYVIVTPENNTRPIERNSLDFFSLPRAIINRNPALGGTYDALRSLQSIPGFNFYGDGSMIFHVRGGDRSQNLILIDDAPLFNPVHLLGFFSAVSPWAVSDIRVYKSDLPEQYPGRVSSVIDIRVKQGDFYKTHVNGEISPILTAFTLDGPIARGKLSYMTSVRMSNINWLYENKQTFLDMGFVDIHTKLSYRPNKKNKISLSLFFSHDKVKLARDFIASSVWWENIAGTFRWNHVFSSRLFLNTTIFTGQYSYFLQFQPDTVNLFNSAIASSGFKQDFTYKLSNNNNLRFGGGATYYFFNPANINNLAYVPTQNVMSYYLYIGDRWVIWDRLKLHFGLVGNKWDNMGPTIVYYYSDTHQFMGADTIGVEVYNSYYSIDPRMSISLGLSPHSIIKLSYGRYTQFLHLLSNSISPFTTVEAWFPANNNILPQKAKQLTLGYFHKGITDLAVEIYAKKITNIPHFTDFATLLFNPYIESKVRQGTNIAAGIEFSLSKTKGEFNYWLSYTYGRVFMKIPELYGNYWLFTSYDKPHNIFISFSYKKNRMKLGASWVYASGNRYSAPVGYYNVMGHYVPIYSYPNNAQLPPYHRLDLYLTYHLNRNTHRRFNHYLTISLFNVYGRRNPVMVNFNKIEADGNFFYVPGNFVYEYQLTPAYYYFLRYIPSLSYRFKF